MVEAIDDFLESSRGSPSYCCDVLEKSKISELPSPARGARRDIFSPEGSPLRPHAESGLSTSSSCACIIKNLDTNETIPITRSFLDHGYTPTPARMHRRSYRLSNVRRETHAALFGMRRFTRSSAAASIDDTGDCPSRAPLKPWALWWSDKRQRDKLLRRAATEGAVEDLQELLSTPRDGSPPVTVDAVAPEGSVYEGRAPLHLAAWAGRDDLLQALLDARADVGVREAARRGSFTPLHIASQRGPASAVRLLLDARADAHAATEDLKLPVHLAASTPGRASVVSLLLERGGTRQLRARCRSGSVPAESAVDLEMASLLVQPPTSTESSASQMGGQVAKPDDDDTYACRTPFPEEDARVLLRNSRADVVRRLLTSRLAGHRWTGSPTTIEEQPSRNCNFDEYRPRGHEDTGMERSHHTTFTRLRNTGSEIEEVNPNSFDLIRPLGRGAFGMVYQVRHKRSRNMYAMKVLEKSLIERRRLQNYAMAERNILACLSHPYIVSMHFAFQTTTQLIMVLQLGSHGTLQKLIDIEKHLEEPLARFYTAELLLALDHLHERDIVYRDLKPENVVLDRDRHALLTDFGLAKERVRRGQTTRSFCGSIPFMPPEILLAPHNHGHTVDVYTLGVVFFDMLTGKPPFFDRDREKLKLNIIHGSLEVPTYVSEVAAQLIKALMQKRPPLRLGHRRTADIQKHAFFVGLDFEQLLLRQLPVPELPLNLQRRPPLTDLSDHHGRRRLRHSSFPQASADAWKPISGFLGQCRAKCMTSSTRQPLVREDTSRRHATLPNWEFMALDVRLCDRSSRL